MEFLIFKWFHCMMFRRCTCSCGPMLICPVWGMCLPALQWEEGRFMVLLLTLPAARCLKCFGAAVGPGLAILCCGVVCKMSHCRKGNASLSRLWFQSTSCFQMKANHAANCVPHFLQFLFYSGLLFSGTRNANACQKEAGGSVRGCLVLAGVSPLAAYGHVLAQLPKSLIDKPGSAKVACTPSFWAKLLYLKSSMEDS